MTWRRLNPSYGTLLGFDVAIPTMRNFGLDARYATILIARNSHTITEKQFEETLTATIYSVEESYWNLAFAEEDLKVKRRSLEVAQTTDTPGDPKAPISISRVVRQSFET